MERYRGGYSPPPPLSLSFFLAPDFWSYGRHESARSGVQQRDKTMRINLLSWIFFVVVLSLSFCLAIFSFVWTQSGQFVPSQSNLLLLRIHCFLIRESSSTVKRGRYRQGRHRTERREIVTVPLVVIRHACPFFFLNLCSDIHRVCVCVLFLFFLCPYLLFFFPQEQIVKRDLL